MNFRWNGPYDISKNVYEICCTTSTPIVNKVSASHGSPSALLWSHHQEVPPVYIPQSDSSESAKDNTFDISST